MLRAHDVCSLICSVPFKFRQLLFFLTVFVFLFAAVPFFFAAFVFIRSGSFSCFQRISLLLFAAHLLCLQRSFLLQQSFLFAPLVFCLQRIFFVCSVSLHLQYFPCGPSYDSDIEELAHLISESRKNLEQKFIFQIGTLNPRQA